ncbi:MAG TPA: hypothetical protein DD982_22765 [Thalassospira sp.]|jgi:hypothetical protein|nr:hypothetical protein [Thalassospira sp.]|tara:strand:+ start:1064 stop:1312 length:249 start_codon:yes stop_codon:yes gene_type:complete
MLITPNSTFGIKLFAKILLIFCLTAGGVKNAFAANHWISGIVTELIQSIDDFLSIPTTYCVFNRALSRHNHFQTGIGNGYFS